MSGMANLESMEIGISGANMRPELPLLRPTIGPPAVDVRDLYKRAGCFTYDPGLGETGICRSTITYVDGDNGVLLYRGYPIDALVESCGYLEICWLLLNGDLPTAAQLDRFTHDITHHTMVNEQLHAIYRGFRRDAHPMAVICGVVGALAAFYHDGLDIFDPHHRMIAAHRLVAKMPTIAAMVYKYSQGQPFVYPRNDLGYTENFLNMLFSVPCEAYRVPDAAARALEAVLIMHGDHEQNASTSAMRFVGSTQANPYACTAAAIAALWGPLHGGAIAWRADRSSYRCGARSRLGETGRSCLWRAARSRECGRPNRSPPMSAIPPGWRRRAVVPRAQRLPLRCRHRG